MRPPGPGTTRTKVRLSVIDAAREIQAELLQRNILTGTSADPSVLRLLPPYILEEEHVDLLARALAEIAP